ncbi:MAG: hypothetical protein HYT30_01220 [Parcubacteria group bacterium]|nr:hypothetical protein [Parcubacteria group bacterium]
MGMIQGLLGKGGGAGAGGGEVPPPTGSSGSLPNVAPSPADFFSGASGSASTNQNTDTETQKAAEEPSATFLNAVSKGFNTITDKITEVTVGITEKAPTKTDESTKTIDATRPDTEKGTGTSATTPKKESSGVSGFYNANTFGPNADLSLIGRVCETRPWAAGLIARFVAPSFFDSMCSKGGYHVGPYDPATQVPVNATEMVQSARERAAAEQALNARGEMQKGIRCAPVIIRQGAEAALEFSCGTGERLLRAVGFRAGVNDSRVIVRPEKTTVYGIQCSNNFEAACEVKVVNPRVVVWSEPKTVRLGSRAVIRWNTQDVEKGSCTVKGNSFSQTGERGGASTVPITGATPFTATCTALDGQPITETLTVDLAL